MKNWLICLILLISGCKEEKQKTEEKILKIGMSVDYPPYEFYQDGKIVGFDVDLSKEIGKRLKRTILFQDMAFEGLIAALQTKKIDAVVSCFTATPERAEKVDFSREYYKSVTRLVVHKKKPIKTVQDLVTVGVQAGSTYEITAKEWQKDNTKLKIHSLQKLPDLIQELKTGRICAILMGSTEVKRLVNSQRDFKMIKIGQDTEGFVIALPKNSLLTKDFNHAITEMEKDGTLQKLQEKWFDE